MTGLGLDAAIKTHPCPQGITSRGIVTSAFRPDHKLKAPEGAHYVPQGLEGCRLRVP